MKIQFSYLACLAIILNGSFLFAFNRDMLCVDFDTSLGKGDRYMNKYFRKLQDVHINAPESSYWKYLLPHSGIELFNLCKKMYRDHSPCLAVGEQQNKIPRIFHQIWVGGKPFPEKYKKWQKSWQSAPGWTYKLWNDEDAEKFVLENKELYYAEKNMGVRADIFRAEILCRFGGVYIDTDFECLQPEIFDLFNKAYDFYTGLQPLDARGFQIANGLIGSIPEHPILRAYIDHLKEQNPVTNNGFSKKHGNIVKRGPGLFSQMILLHCNKKHRDIVLPPTFFYPVACYQFPKGELSNYSDEMQEEIKKDSCKPESAAIHWWESSWDSAEAWIE